jgi:hypothetical protein
MGQVYNAVTICGQEKRKIRMGGYIALDKFVNEDIMLQRS